MAPSLLQQHLNATQAKPAKGRSTAPKPSQVTVEISSGEDEEPVLRGALRGLNPVKNVLPNSTSASVETPQSTAGSNKHLTRGSRHGRAPDVNYSTKYHPMDVVTRPNSKAVRERSKSVSFPELDDDEEESDPTLLGETGDEEEEDDESSDDGETQSRRPRETFTLTPRTPDPKASRHSARTQAKKPVLYSAKFHPQDYGIPGRKRAVVMPTPAEEDVSSSRPAQKRKRVQSPEVQVLSDADADVDEEIPARSHHKPRKALKSIANNNQTLRDSKKKHANRVRPSRTVSPRNGEAETDGNDDLMAILEDIIEDADDNADDDVDNDMDDLSDIPPWLKNRFALLHENEVLTRGAALSLMVEYFQARPFEPLIIRKPYLKSDIITKTPVRTTSAASSATLHRDHAHDTSTNTLAGDSIPEASFSAPFPGGQSQKMPNSTLAGDALAEGPPSSTDDSEPQHHPSQFEEEMAITETPEEQSPCPDLAADVLTRAVEHHDEDLPSTEVGSPHEGGAGASSEL